MAPILALLILGLLIPGVSWAQTVEPRPIDTWTSGAQLDALNVDFAVRDGSSVAHYELKFSNSGAQMAEGRVVLPVPANSAVSELTLTGGPQTLEGRITGADEAARLYEEIVRRLIDPALLRSLGDDLYEIRAFPVPTGEQRQVHFTVTTPLLAASETVQVEIPWARMSPTPAAAIVSGQIDVSWDVRSAIAPTYNLELDRTAAGQLSLSWEAPRDWRAETDFTLYLSGGEGLLDTRLLPYRIPGDDGFFALLLAPLIDPTVRIARDVILVLDTSGSMRGDKLAQAQEAARYVLNRLDPEDRFGIISYASGVRLFGEGLHEAAEASAGIEFVDARQAAGSTNISGALQLAFDLAEGDRPATILFLTDGLPTAGLEDPGAILNAARNANPGRTQLFAFGVGYDVNTILLDSLTREFVGTSHYVTPQERIEREVGSLFEQISSPVLTDVEINIVGGDVSAIAPATVTGIFAGTQTLVTGRYGEAGTITVHVRGNSDSGQENFSYELELPERATADASIAQLWAQQRIADLITEIRLEGSSDSLIEEIVRISTRFGIVTPFTSFIAEEPERIATRGGLDAFAVEAELAAESLAESDSGEAAVAAADEATSLRDGRATGLGTPALQVVGANSYTLVDEAWLQHGYELGTDAHEVTVGSAEFADLIAAQPDLAEAATLGAEVVARGPDGFVRIIWPDPESVDTVTLPSVERDNPGSVTPDSTTTTGDPSSTTDPDPTPDSVEPGSEQPVDESSQPSATLGNESGGGDGNTLLWIGISLAITALLALAGWRVERSMRSKT